jgi:hypothetical protein
VAYTASRSLGLWTGWLNSLDTKVNAFVFHKLPVTVTVTVSLGFYLLLLRAPVLLWCGVAYMHVCMPTVCMYACMHVCTACCMYACKSVCMCFKLWSVCVYACMNECMHEFMYGCVALRSCIWIISVYISMLMHACTEQVIYAPSYKKVPLWHWLLFWQLLVTVHRKWSSTLNLQWSGWQKIVQTKAFQWRTKRA